ncbi:MAG: 4Fe-4S binding protein [Syntrophobacterales bacterium]|nr:MAG: 4Fe-4S binding protein [Syntrophobacterales bacterium]
MKAEKVSQAPEGASEIAPDKQPKPKRAAVTKIDIFKAWCKACGICVAFCPKGVLAIDEEGYPFVEDLDSCTGCGWCEIRCPDFAITVESRRKRRRVERKDEKEAPQGIPDAGE